MDIQFKNFSKKAKAIENGIHPISKTFPGALFKDSSWYLALQDIDVVTPPEAVTPQTSVPVTSQPSLCDVLFLGDTYNGVGEDLLQKMIQAMNLDKDAVKRVAFDENNDDKTQLMKAIAQNKPKIVVSLGAIVTNILLDRKEKLSSIHGQFIPQETSNWKYSMVPIFHPEFLLINPNMKRTAWNDLQKIMEFLKKGS